MQEQMSGAAMAMPADTNKAFKVHFVVKVQLDNSLKPVDHFLVCFSSSF